MIYAPISVYPGDTYRENVLEHLANYSRLQLDNRIALCTDSEDREADWLPEIIRRSTPGKGLGNIIARIILDASSRADGIGAASGEVVISVTLDVARRLIGRIEAGEAAQELIRELQNDRRELQELIQIVTMWPDLQSIRELLASLSLSNVDHDLVSTAIDLAGLEGRIFVERTSSAATSVELSLDHTFRLAPILEVVNPSETWQYQNVRCAVIDGIIETVAEIHPLLESSSQGAQPVVLFCRGFTEEVIATLGVNRKRGTLNVIPVPVSFDPEQANTLKDLAVVLGADVVSALQGHLISSLTWDDLVVSPEITFNDGVLKLRPAGHSTAIAAHLRDLVKRRSDLAPDARRDILDSRIRSLATTSVGIRVGNEHGNAVARNVDLLLRSVRSSVSYGIVDTSDFVEKLPSSVLGNAIRDSILRHEIFPYMPAISLAAVVRFSSEAIASLVNTETAILLDL